MPYRDLQVLGSLLEQGDWCVERPSAAGCSPPAMIKIARSSIKGAKLFLLLEADDGTKSTLEVEISDFTVPEDYDPTRAATKTTRVIITSLIDSRRKREIRAASDNGYWQTDSSGNVGITIARRADAPPGWPCYEMAPYGYAEHIERHGSGSNRLRTEHVAQPQALEPGDLLATGERVLSLPRSGTNGSVLVHMTGGTNGHWISMAARLPIALLVQYGDVPGEMWTLG